jgi:hypothetical protein
MRRQFEEFTIRGGGFSGDIEQGFMFNPITMRGRAAVPPIPAMTVQCDTTSASKGKCYPEHLIVSGTVSGYWSGMCGMSGGTVSATIPPTGDGFLDLVHTCLPENFVSKELIDVVCDSGSPLDPRTFGILAVLYPPVDLTPVWHINLIVGIQAGTPGQPDSDVSYDLDVTPLGTFNYSFDDQTIPTVHYDITVEITDSSEGDFKSSVVAALPSYPGTFNGLCSSYANYAPVDTSAEGNYGYRGSSSYTIRRHKPKFTFPGSLLNRTLHYKEHLIPAVGLPSDIARTISVSHGVTTVIGVEILEPSVNGTITVTDIHFTTP